MWIATAMLVTAAAEEPSGGGLTAVLVAGIGVLGVIATALGPVLIERVKRSGQTPPVTAPVPATSPGASATAAPPVPATVSPEPQRYTADVFDLIEDQIDDLRRQRDAAQAESYELRRALTQAQQRLWQLEGAYRRHSS